MTLVDKDELDALKRIADSANGVRDLHSYGKLKVSTTEGNQDAVASVFSDMWDGLNALDKVVSDVDKN